MRALGVTMLFLVSAAARGQLECAPGVVFYSGGAIRSCELTAIQRFLMPSDRALVCAAGRRAELDPEGRIKRCTLARDYRDGGRRCAAGSTVAVSGAGAILQCKRAGDG